MIILAHSENLKSANNLSFSLLRKIFGQKFENLAHSEYSLTEIILYSIFMHREQKLWYV